MAKTQKTNALRLLEAAGIAHEVFTFEAVARSGVEAAQALGKDPACVFKTLVTQGRGKNYYVFMIPVARELDLKKAAHACGEKSIEMIAQKELLPLTGYVHGGCSPIGMKKQFPTFLDESAQSFSTIAFSAGKVGMQVEASPHDLAKLVPLAYCALCKEI